MIHLHDVDILLKLAACGLLDDLPALLGVDDGQMCVLGTAIHKIRQLGQQKKYAQAVVERSVAFCAAHPDLPDVRDEAAFLRLIGLGEGMEVGEAVLYAVALAHAASFVVSGDKRAIDRIGRLAADDEIKKALRGRVICFEELLLRYRDQHGFERLRARCCDGLDTDGMLRLAFRSGLATQEDEAMQGIWFYWRSLHQTAGGLLAPRAVKQAH